MLPSALHIANLIVRGLCTLRQECVVCCCLLSVSFTTGLQCGMCNRMLGKTLETGTCTVAITTPIMLDWSLLGIQSYIIYWLIGGKEMENSNNWQKVRSLMGVKDILIRELQARSVVFSAAVSWGNVFVPCCLQKHPSKKLMSQFQQVPGKRLAGWLTWRLLQVRAHELLHHRSTGTDAIANLFRNERCNSPYMALPLLSFLQCQIWV